MERSLYPALLELLEELLGAQGISESKASGGTYPDIIFEWASTRWLLSVKLDDTSKKYFSTDTWNQYNRTKAELGTKCGMILVIDKKLGNSKAIGKQLTDELRKTSCNVNIDGPPESQSLMGVTFPQICNKLLNETSPSIKKNIQTQYELEYIIKNLKMITRDLMDNLKLDSKITLKIITDKDLITSIGMKKRSLEEINQSAKFLAAYIFISQVIFLRLFSTTNSNIVGQPPSGLVGTPSGISKTWIRECIARIRNINYKPIFETDVLDAIPDRYVQLTFNLIWNLNIEAHKADLPGRIFHELMDPKTRKMLAAFYTRPMAAELLAKLTIQEGSSTLIDPSCGSGTILVAGYNRKKYLAEQFGSKKNHHKQFCEKDIFGSEIMPFGVHLTAANLASIDPGVTINKAQILLGDSLKLARGTRYASGTRMGTLFPSSDGSYFTAGTAGTMSGEKYDIPEIPPLDTVLMNPPFTKMERGIQKFIDLGKFSKLCGNEVGLWGHFLGLSDDLLKDGGMMGAVIPINIMRGRESEPIRKFILENWTILYIVKTTINYAFSENSEYRDVLFIAKKKKPSKPYKIKVALIKKDLRHVTSDDTSFYADTIQAAPTKNSKEIDLRSFDSREFADHFHNLMWFLNQPSMSDRDILVKFVKDFSKYLSKPSQDYFRDGYGPRPKGVSSFMFLTNAFQASRTQQAFLRFKKKEKQKIFAADPNNLPYVLDESSFVPSLRTPVGHDTMNITSKLDYVATLPYKGQDKIEKSSGFKRPKGFKFLEFWPKIKKELISTRCNLVINRRFGPSSDEQYLLAFFSSRQFSPNDTLNVVKENDPEKAKALCVIANSIILLSQFYLLKQDTTGRYTDLRHHDYAEMNILCEDAKTVKKLSKIFDKYGKIKFPALREQLDSQFDVRYDDFWASYRKTITKPNQKLPKDAQPNKIRLEFDLEVCKTLGMSISKKDLIDVYGVIIRHMIVTRGLNTD